MRTRPLETKTALVSAVVAIALLGGCDKPPPTPERPAPAVPAPEAPAAAVPAPATAPPDAGALPAIAAMRMATSASSKMSVPVDLSYQFEGDVRAGQPVTLHLAAVPRVEGSNLRVTIKEDPGVVMTVPPLIQQKASARTAYRQQFSMTKLAGGPAELRVLVTLDVPEGSTFGWFGVPFNGAQATQTRLPVKQR